MHSNRRCVEWRRRKARRAGHRLQFRRSQCARIFESLESRLPLASQIGSVNMPFDGYLSAGVYDSNGQLIRTLLTLSPQEKGDSVPLMWDGKDSVNRLVLNDGAYTWKALVSQVQAVDEGGVGDSLYTTSYIPTGSEPVGYPDASSAPEGVAVDSSGRVYLGSVFVENGNGLHQYSQSGQLLRRISALAIGVATDSTYLYLSSRSGNNDQIAKINIATLAQTNFTTAGGAIIVNSDAFEPRPVGQKQYTVEHTRQFYSTWGIAVDSHRIWVSNYRNNRIDIYDKVTGVKLDTLSAADDLGFASPLGIAVQSSSAAAGSIWVSHNASQVTRYAYTVSGSNLTFTKSTDITGLNDPTGLAIGGPTNHLFVAVNGDGQIREYEITSGATPAGLGAAGFGTKHVSGPVLSDHDFDFTYATSIAVDSSGILNVIDDRRLQRYYTVDNPGQGIAAGDLKQSIFSEFGAAPLDTYGYTADGKYIMMNGFGHYEVDPLYTGGPREGWLGDGTWRMIRKDLAPAYTEPGGPAVRRILMDGSTPRELRFVSLGDKQSIAVYAVNSSTGQLRRSAIIGSAWYGADLTGFGQPGQYNWTDTNGNGVIDWNSQGTGVDGEVTWFKPLGQSSNTGLPWVDDGGNIWAPGPGGIVKIAMEGFDAQGNPIYNFANMVVVAPNINDDYDFFPAQVRVAANGDIYASGGANFLTWSGSVYIPGYDWMARYDSNGIRKLLIHTPDSRIPALAADETDPNGSFFFSGHSGSSEHWAYMYSNDGLVVARMSPGAATGGWTGWLDHPWGIGAFTHPLTGITYVSISDISNGKAERYRMDNVDTIQRQQGNFQWKYATQTVARWKFDDTLQDTIEHRDGTFFGGTASYVYGQHGKAIDLDGSNDRVEMPSTANYSAYTISAWVNASDTTNVNIIARVSSAGGPLSAAIHSLRINNSGQFEHYLYEPNPGGTAVQHVLTGTTIAQPNVWYHVVGVAQNNGTMRLYVNGQEEGTAQSVGTMYAGTDVFHVGDPAYGASGWLDGLIDDIRVSDQPLRADEVRAIYDEITAERDAYWSLDGNLNDTAGANHATFGGGLPSYATGMFNQAVDFDGIDDYTSAPYTTDAENYTISAWVKPADTTSVGIVTRTSAAGPLVDFFNQLQINSAGQFEHFTVDQSGGHTVTGTTVVQAGRWYHVAGTATHGGMMRLYVNGVEEGQAQNIGTLTTTGDRYYIGSASGGGMGYFGGLIDEVRVYNETASALDIDDLFRNGDVPERTGRWAFDGNLSDSVGANHGAFFGGSPIYATGQVGSAIDLDGSNDYVEIPYAADPPTYTISAWVKPTNISNVSVFARTNTSGPLTNLSQQLRIVQTYDYNGDPIAGQGLFEHLTRSVSEHVLTGTTIVRPNAWYHVAIVATSDGLMRLYVNGHEEGTPLTIGSLATDGDRFHIGNATKNSMGFFDGLVDDFQIYERALSATEIGSVFEGKGNADLVPITPRVTVAAIDNKAAEQGSDPATFTIARDRSVGNLTVNYTMTGQSVNGADYALLSGSIVIPDGQTSVTVTISPVDDSDFDPSETAVLTISPDANYSIGPIASATIVIADNDAAGDPGWTGSNNNANGNSFGWSYNTNQAGGATGEIGGTFARAQVDTYYADLNLSTTLNLSNTITASGKFDFLNISSGWTGSGAGRIHIGHFSETAGSREFIGIEIENYDTTHVQVRAHVQRPISGNDDSDDTPFTPILLSANGNHTFSYTYNPNLGSNGRLTLTINNLSPIYVNIGSNTRNSGAQFDAFGIGYSSDRNTQPGTTKTVQVFIDDATYSGYQAVAPTTIAISATDPTATEHNVSTGTFTIRRDNSAGDLTVNYTVVGTATSGADYTALSGSVLIPNGQTSATVIVTPVNDNLAESDETITLLLSASPNYALSATSSATVTVIDNEPTVNVSTADASAAEIGGNTGSFTITRSTDVGSLVVSYSLSGPATNGTDYSAISGSVTIPNGQTSATITVTPIDDAVLEGSERVVLEITSSNSYFVGAANRATVVIADNDAPTDPGWTGSNNTALGNNYKWNELANFTGGVRGEIGGTISRAKADSYFGDTHLTSALNLNNTITASGTFSLRNLTAGWAGDGSSGFFLGHFSQAAAGQEFIGLFVREYRDDAVRIYARVQAPNGSGDDSGNWTIVSVNDIHTFSYVYDPNQGSFGRLIVTIDSRLAMVVNLSSSKRNSGAVLNAFGMGTTVNMNGESNSAKSIDAFIDTLSYSGLQPHVIPGDFDSDGDVDGADFVAWQTHFPTAAGATLATGDADADGDVDGADFVVWQTHFPTSPSAASSSAGSAKSAGNSSGIVTPPSGDNSTASAASTPVSQMQHGNSTVTEPMPSPRGKATDANRPVVVTHTISSQFQQSTAARGNSRSAKSAAALVPQTRVAHRQAKRPSMSNSVVAAIGPSSFGSIGEIDESWSESRKCANSESALVLPAKPRRYESSVASMDRFYAAYRQSDIGTKYSYRQRAHTVSTGDEMGEDLFEEISLLLTADLRDSRSGD